MEAAPEPASPLPRHARAASRLAGLVALTAAGLGCEAPPEEEAASEVDPTVDLAHQELTASGSWSPTAGFNAPFRQLFRITTETRIPFVALCIDARPPWPQPPGPDTAEAGALVAHVDGWMRQNSGGLLGLGATYVRGCDRAAYWAPPPEHQGDFYWRTGQHGLRWQDALARAAQELDFRQFDTNGDGTLGPHELLVGVIHPGESPRGHHIRPAVEATLNGRTLRFDALLDMFLPGTPDKRWVSGGLITHEAAHAVINVFDMYPIAGQPSAHRPGAFSVMDSHSESAHLDAFVKMKVGWLTPTLLDRSRVPWSNAHLLQPAAGSLRPLIIYEPTIGTREYFIVENRYGGPVGNIPVNYDSRIAGSTNSQYGPIVVWHVFEDDALSRATPPPGVTATEWQTIDPSWERHALRLEKVITDRTPFQLIWGNGQPAHIQLVAPAPPIHTDLTMPTGITVVNTNQTRGPNSIARGQVHHTGSFVAPTTGLRASITGTGDADLYVRKGAPPTDTEWDCRPFFSTSEETCAFTEPGTYFVSVKGFTDASYTLQLYFSDRSRLPTRSGTPQ